MMGSIRMQMPGAAACSHRSPVLRAAPLKAPFTKAFLGAPSMLSSSRSYFTGTSLSTGCQQPTPGRRGMIVEANSKTGIGLTKRGTRRARTRTSGFRARMQTPSGRAVIKARRKKGRHTLCPASNYRK